MKATHLRSVAREFCTKAVVDRKLFTWGLAGLCYNKITMKSKIVIIIFIVVLLLGAAVYLVFFRGGAKGKYGIGIDFNVGIDLSGLGKMTENALKNMPLTNPLEEVANPFRDAYKNPFK